MLNVSSNLIGDSGGAVLVHALTHGALTSLLELDVRGNELNASLKVELGSSRPGLVVFD